MALSKITTESLLDGEITAAKFATGVGESKVVQVVNVTTGAVATTTTVMPYDDTIPQKTEGGEFLTLAITPTHASNKLFIEVSIHVGYSVAAHTQTALFQDSTTGSLASGYEYIAGVTQSGNMNFNHYMTSGTTSSTTFKVRCGGHTAGTVTLNGDGAARKHGGVLSSSITITEIAV